MQNRELLVRVYEGMILPLLEDYVKEVRDHRLKEDSWPRRCIFSDTCKLQIGNNMGKQVVYLQCLIPPTQSFWSAWLAMYILYGDKKYFGTHAKACRSLLKEIKLAKHHVNNLTNNFKLWEWLHQSADGMRYNSFLEDPVKCAANLLNELDMCKNKDADETKLLNPAPAYFLSAQGEFNKIKSEWKREKANSK